MKNLNRNKSICIPLFGAKYHGGIRIIFGIANKLASEGYHIYIFCPGNSWNPIYKLDDNVKVQLTETRSIFSFSLSLISHFYSSKDSIFLLSHWLTGFIYSITPRAVKNNAVYFVQDSEEVFFKKNTIYGKLLRNLVFYGYKNSSSNFIVTTDYGERKLRVIIKDKLVNINKIILGVDKNIFYPDHLVDKNNVILFFPRKGWFKDFDLLISTFNILYKDPQLLQYQFWFVSQEKDLFKSIEFLPRVKCFSVNSDIELRLIYNSSDLLIHTSKYEGICLPILEALSCGTFVVATNSFGPLTYLNRDNSYVCNIRNEHLISNIAVQYLTNIKKSKSEISNSVSSLSLELFISKFTDVLKQILK